MDELQVQKPWKAGVVAGRHRFSAERVQLVEQQFSAAADLADLAQQYLLFTPGLMYCCVNLQGRDPLADFCEETNQEIVPIRLTFDRPLFSGFEAADPAWNHQLLALPQAVGRQFCAWAGTLTFVDRGLRTVARIRYKQLRIVDPLWLSKQVVLPEQPQTVEVTAFCVDATTGCVHLEAFPGPLPRVAAAAPFADTRLLAEALFNESDTPLQDVEARQAVDGLSVAEQEIRQRVRAARQPLVSGESDERSAAADE